MGLVIPREQSSRHASARAAWEVRGTKKPKRLTAETRRTRRKTPRKRIHRRVAEAQRKETKSNLFFAMARETRATRFPIARLFRSFRQEFNSVGTAALIGAATVRGSGLV